MPGEAADTQRGRAGQLGDDDRQPHQLRLLLPAATAAAARLLTPRPGNTKL